MGRGEMGSVGRSVGQLDWIGLDWTGLGFASQAVGGRVGSRGAGQLGSNNDDGVALGACVAAQCRQAGQCQRQSVCSRLGTVCHAFNAGSRGGFSHRAGE